MAALALPPQAGGQRKLLLQVEPHPRLHSGFLEEHGGCAVNQIGAIHWKLRQIAGQFDAGLPVAHGEFVMNRDREKQGFQIMKAVGAPPEDVQDKIDLAGRSSDQRHKKTRQPGLARQRDPWPSVLQGIELRARNEGQHPSILESNELV